MSLHVLLLSPLALRRCSTLTCGPGVGAHAHGVVDVFVAFVSVGQAEAAGLRAGDVMTGASAVFGDAVWSVKEKSIEEIRSLVRCR